MCGIHRELLYDMSLDTLLEAAKYIEYRSEAKARGKDISFRITIGSLGYVPR